MTRHLGDQVSAYVDRRLDGASLLAYDRHVTVCIGCRYAVDDERMLLMSLRAAPEPGPSSSLHQLLIGLGGSAVTPPGVTPSTSSGRRGGVADGTVPPRPTRLATVAPTAPAQHLSPRRATLLAGVAAGASALAAWCLAAAVSPTVATAPVPAPAATQLGTAAVMHVGFASKTVMRSGASPSNVGPVNRAPTLPARVVEFLERAGS